LLSDFFYEEFLSLLNYLFRSFFLLSLLAFSGFSFCGGGAAAKTKTGKELRHAVRSGLGFDSYSIFDHIQKYRFGITSLNEVSLFIFKTFKIIKIFFIYPCDKNTFHSDNKEVWKQFNFKPIIKFLPNKIKTYEYSILFLFLCY
jgi:hypothetical protein